MAFDFGEDVSCVDDLSEEGRVISGPMVLFEALLRRWKTARGSLLDDENYGTDLTEFINETVDDLALARMRSETKGEAEKDERVAACAVLSAFFDVTTSRVRLGLSITALDGVTYRLTISVSSVTVELLSAE